MESSFSSPPAHSSVSLMTDKSIQCLDQLIAHGGELDKLPFSPTTRSALEHMGPSNPVTAEIWGTLPRNLQQRIIEIKRCRPQLFDRSPSVSILSGLESDVGSPWPSDISHVSLWPSDLTRMPFDALQQRQERTWAEMPNAPDDLTTYPALAPTPAAPARVTAPVLVPAPALAPASTSAPTHAYVTAPTPPGLAGISIQQGLPSLCLGGSRGQVAIPDRVQQPATSGYVYPFQDSPVIASPARDENIPEVSDQIQSCGRAASQRDPLGLFGRQVASFDARVPTRLSTTPVAEPSNLRYDQFHNPQEQEHNNKPEMERLEKLDRLAKLRQRHELAVSRWKQHMNSLVDEEVTMAYLEQQALELTVSLSAEHARGGEADDALWRGKLRADSDGRPNEQTVEMGGSGLGIDFGKSQGGAHGGQGLATTFPSSTGQRHRTRTKNTRPSLPQDKGKGPEV